MAVSAIAHFHGDKAVDFLRMDMLTKIDIETDDEAIRAKQANDQTPDCENP